MAGARRLVIEILGNAKDAAKAFGDVRSDSAKTEERLSKFGTAALGAGVAVAAGLAYAVTQFVEADVASQKLNNSAKNSAASAKINASALREVAQATQSKTAADGDALVAGQAMLVQFGATQEQTVALTPLIADLSRKMGVDTESAARAVGKALNGSTTSLQKMGIQVDAAKASTDPFTATMDALRGSVGGFAESEGATAAGTLERIKNQLGDVVEAVGGGALEAFAPLIGAVSGLVSAGGPAGEALGNIGGKLGVIGSTTLLAMGGLIKAKEGIDSIREAASSASGGVGRMGYALGALGAIGVAVAVVGVAQSINDATFSSERFEAALIRVKNARTFELQQLALVELANSSDKVGDKVWDFLMTGSTKAGTLAVEMQGLPVQIDSIGRTLQKTAESGDMAALATQLEGYKGATTSSKAETEALRKVLEPFEQQVKNAADATSGHAGALGEEANKATIAADALDEYSNSLKAQTDPVFAAIRATQQNSDAKQKAADAQAKVTFLERAGMTGSSEYAAAVRDLSRANLDNTASAVGQQSALATLAGKMASGEISAETFTGSLQQLVNSGAISQATMNAMAGSFGLTAGAANNTSREVLGAKGSVNALDGSKAHVTVTADTGSANTALDVTTAKIGELLRAAQNPGVPAEVRTRARSELAQRRGHAGRATGGTVLSGRPYLVGERGPELVVPGSGYVVPTRRLIDAPTGGTSGGGVVVNVTTGVGDPVAIGREVVAAVKAYERTTGTAWRS